MMQSKMLSAVVCLGWMAAAQTPADQAAAPAGQAAAPAAAAPAAPPPYVLGPLTFSGLVDIYYNVNLKTLSRETNLVRLFHYTASKCIVSGRLGVFLGYRDRRQEQKT